MASIVTYGNGLRRIDFSFSPNERRKHIRLGRISRKQAERWLAKVEAILADKQQQRPHDPELANWLSGLDEAWLKKLRTVGLADGVGMADSTLGDFLADFFAKMPGKASTRTFYGHTRRNLEDYFTKARMLRTIGDKEAEGWRRWLVDHEKLSPATVARRVKAARTLFRKAIKWKLARENPFAELKAGAQTNEGRKVFVPTDVIETVIAECPDNEWKVIVALSRYGGLRMPSEAFALRWGDINWERGTVLVHCPKLEHNERFATRSIPLFPEIRTHLLALFSEAEAGTEYVIARNRLDSLNLRTRFEKIIQRAGVKPWPKLFHNLRASRETELMRDYDLTTVCRWIGNSPEIAARHYAMSQDFGADFRRAAALPDKAQQNAQQTAAGGNGQRVTEATNSVAESLQNEGRDNRGQTVSSAANGEGWAMRDSNPRHPRCKHGALTN